MNRDPFLRLALVVAASAYMAAIAALLVFLSLVVGLVALAGGLVVAMCASVELERTPLSPDPRRRHRQPKDRTEGFERVT